MARHRSVRHRIVEGEKRRASARTPRNVASEERGPALQESGGGDAARAAEANRVQRAARRRTEEEALLRVLGSTGC